MIDHVPGRRQTSTFLLLSPSRTPKSNGRPCLRSGLLYPQDVPIITDILYFRYLRRELSENSIFGWSDDPESSQQNYMVWSSPVDNRWIEQNMIFRNTYLYLQLIQVQDDETKFTHETVNAKR